MDTITIRNSSPGEEIWKPFPSWFNLTLKFLLTLLLLLIPTIVCAYYADWKLSPLILVSKVCQSSFICGVSGLFSRRWLSMASAGFSGFLFCLAATLEAAAYYTTGEGFSIGFYQQLTFSEVYNYATFSQRLCLLAVFLMLCFLTGCVAFIHKDGVKGLRRSLFVLLALLGGAGAWLLPSSARDLLDFARSVYYSKQIYALDPEIFARSGMEVSKMDLGGLKASPGKNLVFVYLESIERAFIDQRRFPGMMPEMASLAAKESLNFDNIRQAPNSGYTYAGVYSSMTGSYLVPANIRDGKGNVSAFGARSISYPQVLRAAGYRQVFMRAAPMEFACMNVLLSRCGFDETWSSTGWVSSLGLTAEDNWGCFDFELFEKAFLKYQTLSESGRPFNLTILTVDTHSPSGRVPPDKSLPADLAQDAKLRMAYHNTDAALARFIQRLKESKAWKDTVVVVMNDHLARPCALSKDLKPVTDRKMLLFALNAGEPRAISVKGMTFDVAPTVLDMLGVKHNNVFPVGDDLLADPNPARLNVGPEQEECLTALMLSESSLKMEDSFNVEIDESPFPSLVLGSQRVPLLLIGNGGQEMPRKEESFIVVLDSSRTLSHYQRFLSRKEALAFIKSLPKEFRYVFIGAPGSCGAELARHRMESSAKLYWLVYGGGGSSIAANNAVPDDLHLSKDDVASFEKFLRESAAIQKR